MSILIDKSTRLIVQGITGRDGLFHARKMKEYGTNVVGGTSPGKGELMQTVSQCLTPCMKLWNRRRLTLLLSLFRHVLQQMLSWRRQMPVSS